MRLSFVLFIACSPPQSFPHPLPVCPLAFLHRIRSILVNTQRCPVLRHQVFTPPVLLYLSWLPLLLAEPDLCC